MHAGVDLSASEAIDAPRAAEFMRKSQLQKTSAVYA